MLPHSHFIIAGLVIFPVRIILFPESSIIEIVEWVLVGGFLSSAIDLDVYTIALLKSKKEDRLKPFRNPLELYRKTKLFMDAITETGVLKIGLAIHLLSSMLIILAFYFFWNAYLIPVTLGVISHLMSDIPNLRRLMKWLSCRSFGV